MAIVVAVSEVLTVEITGFTLAAEVVFLAPIKELVKTLVAVTILGGSRVYEIDFITHIGGEENYEPSFDGFRSDCLKDFFGAFAAQVVQLDVVGIESDGCLIFS